MSSKNTQRYSSGIIVKKKKVSTANARCYSDQRCMMTEGFKLQTALPSDVFHRATYKDVGMALNLNRVNVSVPSCISQE